MDTKKFVEREFSKINQIQELDAGGQKVVYKGVHTDHGNVALKLILDTDNFERTVREIEIVSNYNIPNVPSIYSFDLTSIDGNKVIYIVEQFIEGDTLSTLLKSSSISEKAAIDYLLQLLQICCKLEDISVVHRDIKPANIVIDEDNKLWLLDFGIARHLDMKSITPTNAYYGPHTLGYAAPEQIDNLKAKIDIRADLFSIGVLFYEMISGKNPFKENCHNRLDIIRRTKNHSPDQLDLDIEKGEELSRLISVMIEKYPSRRPKSAKENVKWLKEIIN